MKALCWSCAEPYDAGLVNCPQCGASNERPKHEPKTDTPKPKPRKSK